MTTQHSWYEIASVAPSGCAGVEYAHTKREAAETVRWLRANGYTQIAKPVKVSR